METRVIQNLIQSYFDLVKKNIADLVPKTVMAFLVNESRKIAQSELVECIYKQGCVPVAGSPFFVLACSFLFSS